MKKHRKRRSTESTPEYERVIFPRYARTATAQDLMKTSNNPADGGDDVNDEVQQKKSIESTRDDASPNREEQAADAAVEPQNEFTVTPQDLSVLGTQELSGDGGDDEQLRNRVAPVDFAGKDLDIPGAELDDKAESVGSEDEENNGYSLASDSHNNLDESKT